MSALLEDEPVTTTATGSAAALDVRGLTKHFGSGGLFTRHRIRAVDDVSFSLEAGKVTALVGESGSGKSTVARLLSRLYKPTDGVISFHGKDVSKARGRRALLRYRSEVQMIFQDPFASLNPVKKVEHHLARPLRIHDVVPGNEVHGRVLELLNSVGLVPAEEIADKFPHQLSGGQRQRVAIARALAVEPKVILADEPISMLDVSIRLGVLNLMLDLKEKHDIAFLYVTHDIASARYVADEVMVMYAGQIVEHGPTDEVLHHAMHPYTQLLLSAVPNPEEGLRLEKLPPRANRNLVPSHLGCRFVDRCPLAVESCFDTPPALLELRPNHFVRCPVVAPAA
jgi:peptide/nickel transport system ATP-binding protein